jgi:ketosteroid isomerase-like protein
VTTQEIVQAYHRARFSGDVPAAEATLADGFTFESPLMTATAADHLAELPAFLGIVTGVDMTSELYGEEEATLVYDVHTATPVGTQRTAEHFRLRDGRIAEIRLIFDASVWRQVMAAR